jgi:hypothetical protein
MDTKALKIEYSKRGLIAVVDMLESMRRNAQDDLTQVAYSDEIQARQNFTRGALNNIDTLSRILQEIT